MTFVLRSLYSNSEKYIELFWQLVNPDGETVIDGARYNAVYNFTEALRYLEIL